ncbi:CsbD family protein [Isobaculum melis]|uniref:CsbD-like n=1 Tax=Isobaculum melis TaxID=142588 RepID=A0A1H9U1L0_9LACT|nr:hypothetical protein [Isobaculum melis]SES03355.1 hypothetical protein SAMN04488559_1208 [Isobaculum melis]
MTDFKEKLENVKDKVAGEVKEGVGKVFHNEELELKGKTQVGKADAEKKVHDKADEFSDKAHETKDKVIGKANDKIDELKNKK